MEFNMLQEYYTFTKGVVYVIMGGILVAVTLYWSFLFGGKDDAPNRYAKFDEEDH